MTAAYPAFAAHGAAYGYTPAAAGDADSGEGEGDGHDDLVEATAASLLQHHHHHHQQQQQQQQQRRREEEEEEGVVVMDPDVASPAGRLSLQDIADIVALAAGLNDNHHDGVVGTDEPSLQSTFDNPSGMNGVAPVEYAGIAQPSGVGGSPTKRAPRVGARASAPRRRRRRCHWRRWQWWRAICASTAADTHAACAAAAAAAAASAAVLVGRCCRHGAGAVAGAAGGAAAAQWRWRAWRACRTRSRR